MLTSNCAQVSEELLKRQLHDAAKIYSQPVTQMKCASTTSILSQKNKACNGTNESVKTVILLHCITPFFLCRMQTTDYP